MKTKEKEVKDIRSHLRSARDSMGDTLDREMPDMAQLRSAASQMYEALRATERLIGRIETEQDIARKASIPAAADDNSYAVAS